MMMRNIGVYGFLCLYVSVVLGGKQHHEEGKKGDSVAAVMVPGKGGQFITAAPMVGCAAGYRLADDRCERLDYAPGELICPKHASLIGDQCLMEERIGASIQCPPGATRGGKHGGCEIMETMIPLVDCPKGWEPAPDEQRCMRVHHKKGKTICPDGFVSAGKHGGDCERIETFAARPACPPGYILEENGKKHSVCLMVEFAPPEVFCPKDFIADNGVCIRLKMKAKEHAACPLGFEKSHKGECERLITQEPIVTCPHGMILIPDGGKKGTPLCRGAEYAPVVPSCMKGYVFSNNRCEKKTKHEARIECQKGFELGPDGRCFGVETIEAITECPPGAVARGKHCYIQEQVGLETECPKHSNLVGNMCVTHEIIQPQMICPDGFKKGKKNEGICEVEQVIVAEMQCPPNGRLSGKKHCIFTTATPAEPICKKGELTPKGCVERVKKEPHTECPKGFKKYKGNCKREVSLPVTYVCPPGAVLQEGNQCLATTITPPAFSCPHHFTMDAQNNCVNITETDPILACPSNTVLTNGQCFHASFQTVGGKKHKKAY